ncbi:beta-fructofuranosidase [Neobacillus bataviensis]|uniref:Sucrose-6-phosphate hydrolase n=1 Tax=Neobacillus bataviensis TaxID=220685 RepID=A0A561DPD3_9BACI|nr:sucrose-6-phosphate hydrolase [Neobacillus bataviensis]TWE05198.1 beta-fructofuranosidase [Neobacillus bataviensis]
MIWTKEQRYRRIEEASKEEILKLQSEVEGCQWRQTFHIQPETGLLNDPNGFSYYNGEYHLFYQWFPLGPVHGLKYWYHTKSKDLVHWENAGIGIEPSSKFDRHGAYSGSAIEHEGKLHFLYTGNTRDENWVRHPYQCLAFMDVNGKINKLEQPVIDHVPYGYTDHFRDPKVWKAGNEYYAVIGAQRENETGCVVLYRSLDLQNWNFEGELRTSLSSFGYMWECPDYFELQDQGVLIFSPQGLNPNGDMFQNIYQSGYVLGEPLDVRTRTLTHGSFQELDRGFDFYAPQTMLAPDGRRILVGWMGLPEMDYPTDKNGWAHCLTLPRELSIRGSKLIQQPVKELQGLRKQQHKIKDVLFDEKKVYEHFNGTSFEMICEFENFDAEVFGVEFRAGTKEKTILKYDALQKKVILDRTFSGEPVGEQYGTERKCSVDGSKIKLHLFADISSVEIFINDGEEVFTSRIFPGADSKEIRFFAEGGRALFQASKWDI